MEDPYFSTTNTKDPTTRLAFEMRKTEYEFWTEQIPDLDSDFELVTQSLYRTTGVNQGRIGHILMALYRLEELPQLKELQHQLYHLDLDRLIAINKSLNRLGNPTPEVVARIDEQLTAYLTPTRANQAMRTQAQIKRKINELINLEDDTLVVKKGPTQPRYTMENWGNNTAAMTLSADPSVMACIDKCIKETALNLDCSLADAAISLLPGNTEAPQVILNAYKATDVPNSPAFIESVGWLDPARSNALPYSKIREMNPDKEVKGYVTPADMAAYLEGFDGTCRYPGCNRPATGRQKDHRINHADGGPTTPANLACLCQHHHNIKTDGRAFYVMDPHTRDIIWLFEDGTWTVTEPSGPLAEKNKNWVQTFAQTITAHRARAYEEAHEAQEKTKTAPKEED
ncbi:HNH endonuclease [Corynebacterium macginleyi]|nr:HNH endonuclease [Corynebacterium macginleyi]